jgi:hypothetical protein
MLINFAQCLVLLQGLVSCLDILVQITSNFKQSTGEKYFGLMQTS